MKKEDDNDIIMMDEPTAMSKVKKPQPKAQAKHQLQVGKPKENSPSKHQFNMFKAQEGAKITNQAVLNNKNLPAQ